MELKLVDKDAPKLPQCLGISVERTDELIKLLDDLAEKKKDTTVHLFYLYNEIAGWCTSLEEFLFCVLSHSDYVARTYRYCK